MATYNLRVCSRRGEDEEQVATVQMKATDTVEQLRRTIALELGGPPLILRVCHNDKLLQGTMTLAEVGLQNSAAIVITRKRGLLVTGSGDSSACIWDASTQKHTRKLDGIDGHKDCVCSVAYSMDSSYIATGSWDKTQRCGATTLVDVFSLWKGTVLKSIL